jgi:hypothetical protein
MDLRQTFRLGKASGDNTAVPGQDFDQTGRISEWDTCNDGLVGCHIYDIVTNSLFNKRSSKLKYV